MVVQEFILTLFVISRLWKDFVQKTLLFPQVQMLILAYPFVKDLLNEALIPTPFYHGWKNSNGQNCVDWGDELFPKEIQDILEDLPEATKNSDDTDSDICLDEPNISSDDDSDVE